MDTVADKLNLTVSLSDFVDLLKSLRYGVLNSIHYALIAHKGTKSLNCLIKGL